MIEDTAASAGDVTVQAWNAKLSDARSGDTNALGALVDSLRSYLWLITNQDLPKRLQGKFSASDIVQHSFADAHQHFDEFVGDTEAELQGWLKTIVKNNLRDHSRRYVQTESRDVSREASLLSGEHAATTSKVFTPSRIVSLQERDRELLAAVECLPEKRRLVVNLRHREQLSYADIGQRLGLSEVAARKLWSRSMEELRTTLSHYYDHETA